MSTAEENAPRGPVAWILTRQDLHELVEAIRGAERVVIDLETTGLDEHAVTGGGSNGGVAARIALASLTLPQRDSFGLWDRVLPTTYIVPLSHPDSPFLGEWRKVMRLIARTMVKYRKPFENHHAKFDARWIYATTGIDIIHLLDWDTQSSSHLIDETQSTALKERVPREFGIPRWDDHDLSYPGAAEEVNIWELGIYAARDTYWTWELGELDRHRLFITDPDEGPQSPDEYQDAHLGRLARIVSMPTARSLGTLEQRGIRLDLDYVTEQLAVQKGIAGVRLDEISELYSLPREGASTAANSKWFLELIRRGIDVGELRVLSMTKTGNAQWDKFVLAKLARQGSHLAQLILDQRDAAKQAEFFTSWLDKVTPEGFIHSTYRAGHVVTGRLSSTDPNMQQVSRKMKRAFLPRPGYVFAEFDYSQLELRVAAFLSRSVPMLEAFAAGQDLHRLFGADILTREHRKLDPNAPLVQLDEVSDEYRQRAKAGNFGLLYLQEAEGFRGYAEKVYGVELTEEEALDIYTGFFETWTGMHEWHQETIRKARQNGRSISPLGRIRNLPDIFSPVAYLRGAAERQAVNAPVQGFGSDLMQMSIASMYGYLDGTQPIQGAFPVATVHDSVEVELEEDRWEEQAAEVIDRMENLDPHLAKFNVTLDVPLVADAKIGRWWGDDSVSHPAK